MMFLELWGIFLIGYPVGSLLGNLGARALYSRFSRVFTGEDTVPGSFMTDVDSLVKNFAVMSVLLVLVSMALCRKLVKMNLMQILRKNPAKQRSRKIYSLKQRICRKSLLKNLLLRESVCGFILIVPGGSYFWEPPI